MTDDTSHTFKLVAALLAVVALTGMALPTAAKEPAAAAAEEAAKSHQNRLRWSTATELNNFGYHVYRGDSEEGPFERLTAEPILGAGTTDEPSHYQFIDEDIDPFATYWYYIESISSCGAQERFTPIFRKQPKLARGSSDADTGSEPAADGR